MLQLYDVNKNKIKCLVAYKDYCIESVLKTGDKTLSFLYPKRLGKEIKNEGYIRNKTDEFVIKSIGTSGDWLSINASLNVENLEGKDWESFFCLEQTIEQCLSLACAGTGWIVNVTGVTKKRTVRMTNCSSWDIIQQARKTYLVEYKFDTINKIIYVKEKQGQDKGTYFTEDLNLKKLDINNDSYDFFTRIKPIGKDNLRINVNGKDYLENYQYSTKVKTLIWKDERYTVASSLLEDATIKLNELSKPRVAYKVDIIDLAKLNIKYKNILDYSLGDTIYLVSKENGVREKQRIVKIKEYPDEPERNTCEVANTILNFEDIQKEYQDTVDTVNNITSDNGTVSENAIAKAVEKLTINKVEMNKFIALEGTVGSLTVNKLNVDVANIKFAEIDTAIAKKIEVTDLTAGNIKFEVAEGGTLNLQTLLSKFITGESGQFLNLTSSNVVIDKAVIKDAMIDTISASKINTGVLDTNLVTVQGPSGNLLIKDNTIQIKDANRTRVQIGKDASNDYNMYVWDSAGKLMFDATGLKADGIKSKIIRDDMISDTANINGAKINISSLITEVNKDTNTSLIKASKVAIDLTGQSLEVSFNSLKSNVDNKESRNLIRNSSNFKDFSYWDKSGNVQIIDNNIVLTGAATSVTFIKQKIYNIPKNTKYTVSLDVLLKDIVLGTGGKLWVQLICRHSNGSTNLGTETYDLTESKKYVFTQKSVDVDYGWIEIYVGITNATGTITVKNVKAEIGENYNPVWTPAQEDIEEKIQANTTSITAVQGQVGILISDNTINKSNITTLQNNYTTIDATVNGLKTTVSSHTTSITNAQNTANNANTLADSKAKVFTSTPTTPYKIGDLWVQGTSGDVMRCKVARATGSYVATDWEKASKYTDDTKANAVEVKLNNLSGKVTTVETKQATLEQNIEGFKTTVSSTYSTKTELNTLNDTVTVVEQRVNTVEQNITATAITTTISSAINTGTSSITTTKFTMNKDGLAIKNGGLKIQNNAGTEVLTADVNGNLWVKDSLTVGGNTNGNIQVKNASNVNIFTVSKNGVFLKDGTMKVTSGNVNWNGITYPEGNTRDMTIYAYGTSIEEKDYSGSQVYKRLAEYFGGRIKLVEDNRENAEQTYYETLINARSITTSDIELSGFLKSTSGYSKLPNGLIVQWGKVKGWTGGQLWVTFPITFPNNALSIIMTSIQTNAATANNTVASFLKTGFNFNSNINDLETFWIAIGY